jgi:hypothetical protein
MLLAISKAVEPAGYSLTFWSGNVTLMVEDIEIGYALLSVAKEL